METKEIKAPAPKQEVKKDTWEYKDRNYYLVKGEPLTYTLPSRHSARYPLVWFDPDIGYERELRYASNHKSIFVDEQKGSVTLKHIVFLKGHLNVPKEKRNFQEFLNKHPHNGVIFREYDHVVEAEDQFDNLELEIAALNMAYEMDVDKSEAILRVELGSKVSSMSSKEVKRDLILFAKRNPALLINLAEDENVELRNFAIKAREANIIKLDADQKTFKWAANGRKLMTVPFDENPYSAMASWFKTDEGIEVYKSIDKKFK
ncbi:MAG: hypothetical protein OET18_08280 [Desulfobacterales bacterium]|jgi:hypothetical protein|nr:hypothetical protein [Desulfobacterales bacterium]